MNWFDLTLASIVLFYVLAGIGKGFGRSAVSFLAFVLAICCGFWFYGPLGFWLRSYIHPAATAHAVGFVLVFCAVMVVGCIGERRIGGVIKEADLTWLDRFLGGCFGIVQGALAASLVVLGIMAFGPKPLPAMVMQSRFAPQLANAAMFVARSAPDEVREGFDRARRDLDKVLPEQLRQNVEKLGSSVI